MEKKFGSGREDEIWLQNDLKFSLGALLGCLLWTSINVRQSVLGSEPSPKYTVWDALQQRTIEPVSPENDFGVTCDQSLTFRSHRVKKLRLQADVWSWFATLSNTFLTRSLFFAHTWCLSPIWSHSIQYIATRKYWKSSKGHLACLHLWWNFLRRMAPALDLPSL